MLILILHSAVSGKLYAEEETVGKKLRKTPLLPKI